MKLPLIKSKNFILRPFRRGDENSLRENINNRKIYENTATVPYPYTVKDAKYWVGRSLKILREKNPEEINFVIEKDGEVAGSISLMKIESGHKAEIGYWLGEKYWGSGIMTEAVRLTSNFGFKKFRLKRIYGEAFSFNVGSRRVLEKSGFKVEGLLKKHFKKDGKFIDLYVFGKVK